MYQRILIATDGSELAQKGVDHGLALAKQLGAEIVVVTVSEPIVTGFDDALGWGGANSLSSEYQKSQDESAQKVLDQVRSKAEPLGLSLSTEHVRDRYAAEAIAETAQARACDLIVMASHGRRGLGRLLIGSQTQEVLTHCGVPVLVVR